jgi:hypothetical protein
LRADCLRDLLRVASSPPLFRDLNCLHKVKSHHAVWLCSRARHSDQPSYDWRIKVNAWNTSLLPSGLWWRVSGYGVGLPMSLFGLCVNVSSFWESPRLSGHPIDLLLTLFHCLRKSFVSRAQPIGRDPCKKRDFTCKCIGMKLAPCQSHYLYHAQCGTQQGCRPTWCLKPTPTRRLLPIQQVRACIFRSCFTEFSF